MPNHCSNKLVVRGSVSVIDLMIEKVRGSDSAFDFEKIVPMPESLNIESGSTTDYALAIIEYYDGDSSALKKVLEYPWVKSMNIVKLDDLANHLIKTEKANMINGLKAKHNMKTYGHKDWYDWKVHHWGTKWNAYDGDKEWSPFGQGKFIRFVTAWGPPVPVIEKLSKEFPSLAFDLRYSVEGEGTEECIYIESGKAMERV